MCGLSLSNLSFDSLELRDDLSPERKTAIKIYSARFNRADRLVLYPIAVVLIIDLLVLLYQVTEFTPDNVDSESGNVFKGQVIFIVLFTLVMMVARVAIFKFLLLHPALSLIRARENASEIWMLSLSAFSFVSAVMFSMTVGILTFLNNEGTALLMLIFTIIAYILCLIFYRLHIASYIQQVSEQMGEAGLP